jgi:hypothetical protein
MLKFLILYVKKYFHDALHNTSTYLISPTEYNNPKLFLQTKNISIKETNTLGYGLSIFRTISDFLECLGLLQKLL